MKLFSILRSYDQMPALKKAGADGILLGIEGLSYRMPNYSINRAAGIQREAKVLGLDVFLVLNRLLDEDEIEDVRLLMKDIDQNGFKGIYFQDLAYVDFLKDAKIELIYAPEAIITSSKEVEILCSSGIDRVMVAKELTLEEVEYIASTHPSKVELFGFGHLPMSVSRRTLVRNYLEEINSDQVLSEGTGLRLKEEKRTVYYPVLEDKKETVIFTDTVFCLLSELCGLADHGVYSVIADDLFVDEKLLPEFISACNRVLDRADPQLETKRLSDLAPEFSFSSGYFYKKTNLTKEGVVQ